MQNDKLFFLIQALVKNVPFKSFVWLRRTLYRPFFKKMGSNVRIMDCVTIKYPSEIEIGDNVTINEYAYIVGLGGLSVGDQCMIGAGSKITSSTHRTDSCDASMASQGLKCEQVLIGDDVFLGFDVKVMPGVKVGNGCIVGAGAVLLKRDYEDYSNIVGVPAKVVGTRRCNGRKGKNKK